MQANYQYLNLHENVLYSVESLLKSRDEAVRRKLSNTITTQEEECIDELILYINNKIKELLWL